jgi:hypothetical protein
MLLKRWKRPIPVAMPPKFVPPWPHSTLLCEAKQQLFWLKKQVQPPRVVSTYPHWVLRLLQMSVPLTPKAL